MEQSAQAVLGDATETALVVLVPEADPLVDAHRQQFDVSASWGVPAHLSVIYPFVTPRQVDDAVLTGLADLLAAESPFDCTFTKTAWFGDEMLYLVPEPDEPFRRLTRIVAEAFPDHPPYRGAHGDPVPHLSIGQRRRGDLAGLEQAQEVLCAAMPLHTRIDTAALYAGTREAGSWQQVRTFPLGRPTR
ncbi:2'-5' RNA ligase family protein [Modestobacter sp. VKM Ac-2985]|uniref:2'-5' RNA ligase family protein n=1 Tax=Modestobacter sp. VKM Ac-2985 TaxID=3004139 RepID=UPI0022AB5098|nr:2'-5' RNA ligase family protein [Modestobacter sp. VKM Ac-2985]MCZ2837420.1 2'-5' RNA ligase family protein [Modestobacter sp. VKM Ac-2985]